MNSDDERALSEGSAYGLCHGAHHVLTDLAGWYDSGFIEKKDWERTASITDRQELGPTTYGGDVRAERLVTQFMGFHLVSTLALMF
jgi:hypothetical protein